MLAGGYEMYKFSKSSLSRLETCHGDLQILFRTVILHRDCTILAGHRQKAEQDAAYTSGNSQLKWPKSKHNALPSLAVDVINYPIDWKKHNDIIYFAGFVMGIADILYSKNAMRHKIRWGGDWNQNHKVSDERFLDLVHFELIS